MWNIDEQPVSVLVEILQEMPSCYLISGVDGEIYWANAAFLHWTGYSSISELKKAGWQKLSAEGADLQADMDAAGELKAGRIREYLITKQYVPKGGKPEWGQLFVQRKPAIGNFEFAVCNWNPLKNGTASAFGEAMQRCEKIQEQLSQMNQHISTLTTRTEEENWINATIRVSMKHPKIAFAVLVVIMSIFGVNNILDIAEKIGLIEVQLSKPPAVQEARLHGLDLSQPRWVAVD